MTFLTRRSLLSQAAAGLAFATGGALAQTTWPAKPVTLIVPFPAGGGTDAFARPMSGAFAKQTGNELLASTTEGDVLVFFMKRR